MRNYLLIYPPKRFTCIFIFTVEEQKKFELTTITRSTIRITKKKENTKNNRCNATEMAGHKSPQSNFKLTYI